MTTTLTDRIYGVTASLALKAPVKAASTANLTLSGEQTVDGVALVTGDRVLVKNQSTASANGIYDVDTSTWRRSADFDGARDVVTGTLVLVNSGTANAQKMYRVSTTGTITVGTTSITFTEFAADGADGAPGASGSGSGDMLAANNLSDVANASTSRTNLGLGTIATQNANNVTITGGSISNTTISGLTSDVTVADGGTGAGSFTDGGVLIGNGTGAIQVTSAGTAGQVLTSNGAGVDPTFQTPASATGSIKAWLVYNISTSTIIASSNVASVVKNATGDFTITFTNAMSSANYAVSGCADDAGSSHTVLEVKSATTTTLRVQAKITNAGGNADRARQSVIVIE